jgi:2-polyprenyl-3-methyl-5-hydroxy-6-metoxy-1,4-benzoquinol methylase
MRYTVYALEDGIDFILGKRDSTIPPKRMIFIGDGDFKQVGNEFLKYFIELGGTQKSDNVLDVGCGIGRMAIPLTNYLDSNSRYEGIDIVESGINWCKKI